ncbi:MAG: F0F1 ATP synthase subunit B [Deltaproteobacteria bacterium]|nr:F0F1 ATP synthase subunit B [Deltaproteobacteria bacterium]
MQNLSLFLISLTAAPESTPGGEHGGVSPFEGDFGNVLWTMIIFLAVLFVLNKFAWGPILSGLQGREQFIRDSLEQAKRQRDESEARLQEYESKLATARTETEEILNEARRDAAALREREESKAKAEAEQLLERAKREIQIAQDTAVKDLYSQAAGLATNAASRILQRELNPADHERLIEESIASIGKMDQN